MAGLTPSKASVAADSFLKRANRWLSDRMKLNDKSLIGGLLRTFGVAGAGAVAASNAGLLGGWAGTGWKSPTAPAQYATIINFIKNPQNVSKLP